jgi:hypothetical protein
LFSQVFKGRASDLILLPLWGLLDSRFLIHGLRCGALFSRRLQLN